MHSIVELGDYYITVNGWDKYYITDNGRLFRRDGRNKGLCEVGYTDKFGYRAARLRDNGRRKDIRVHTLVWKAFRGDIPKGYVIDHINNLKDDNRLVNLQCNKWKIEAGRIL